jgi:hypothetical protein
MPDETTAPSGLYKIWRLEKAIWTEGLGALKDVMLDDAFVRGPLPTDRRTGQDIMSMPRTPRPFKTVEFKCQTYQKHGDLVLVDYVVVGKHPRFRRAYMAQCQTTWILKSTDGSVKWMIVSHMHRALDRKSFLEITTDAKVG